MRSQARALTETKARPGGRARDFWLPTTTTSTPQAAVSSAMAPAPEIASTTSSVSGTSARDTGQCFDVVAGAGGGLVQLDEDALDLRVGVQRAGDFFGGDRFTPSRLQDLDLHAVGLADVRPPLAEISGHQRDHLVAGAQDVHERRFHASGTRAGEHEDVVLGLQETLEAGDALLENGAELVGPMVRNRTGHRLEDGGVQGRGSGREESWLADHRGPRFAFHNICGKPCGNFPAVTP